MRKTPIIISIGVLVLGLFALLAAVLSGSHPPLLRITDTSFPGCETRTYNVTPTVLYVTNERGIVTIVRLKHASSEALMRAISHAHVTALDSSYEEPNVYDGFELSFQFNISHPPKTVTVKNRYVPSLDAILEECDKLLPPECRLSRKHYFVEQNNSLDRLVGQYTADQSLPEELRSKIIAELQKRKAKIAE